MNGEKRRKKRTKIKFANQPFVGTGHALSLQMVGSQI